MAEEAEDELEPMSKAGEIMLLGRLSNGKATQGDRDLALATALVEVRSIRKELWKPEDLRRYIREEHADLCSRCSIRISHTNAGGAGGAARAASKPLVMALKIIGGAIAGGLVICLLCLGVKFAEIVQAAGQLSK